jgi:hypothetical protein
MVNFGRNAPPIAVVLASLLLWVSFAWGLPAEAPAEGEADVAAAEDTWRCGNCDAENVALAKYCTECGAKKAGVAGAAAEDRWAGVRISGAYNYAKCTRCGKKNQIRAESCSRCGNEFPQPSAEMTDPNVVFVPGRGYYREGTLLEPGKSQKGYWITGLFLSFLVWPVGIPLLIYGLATRTEPVYAFASGERYDLYERPAYARRSPDSEGATLKVEVTLLGF